MRKIDTGRLKEDAYYTKLPNGLMVYLIKKSGYSEKAAFLGVNYGSANIEYEIDGNKRDIPLGTAHFLEHKLFDLPDGRNTLQMLSQMGASPNAFTSRSATAYYFTCIDNFKSALELLMEFVFTPYFTAESVEKEQGIIAQEISMRLDMPEARVFDELFAALYKNHPVRHPVIGTHDSIKTITDKTLHECYSAFYRPSNMVLVVVGDLEPDEIEEIALRMSPENTSRVRNIVCDEPLEVAEYEKIISMNVPQTMFSLGIKLVPQSDRQLWENNCNLALTALIKPLSRLYGELYDNGLIDSGFSCAPLMFDAGGLLYLFGRSDDPQAVRDAVVEEIDVLSGGFADNQLFERVLRTAWGDCLRESDDPSALARSVGLNYLSGNDYFNLPNVFDEANSGSLCSLFSNMRHTSLVVCKSNKEDNNV
ncbi:MAG: insulinase family protein [Oscillospiraceae bacterium]|nr:insulinase family protein [Oscillospiraceae bacterium]